VKFAGNAPPGRPFLGGHDDVFALDAATGKQKWAYKPTQIPGEMPSVDSVFACSGRNNHGVVFVPGGKRKDDDSNSESAADDKSDREQASPAMVVFGRLDDVVVALNAKTGTVVWKTAVVDFHSRATINRDTLTGDNLKAARRTGPSLSTTDVAAIQADGHRWSRLGRSFDLALASGIECKLLGTQFRFESLRTRSRLQINGLMPGSTARN
jgi:outer membrane protein assembly factor BamB